MFQQKRRYNKNPARRRITGPGGANQRTRQTPILITLAEVDATPSTYVRVTFDQPVQYTGILPDWPTFKTAGAHVVSVTEVSAEEWTITASDPIITSPGALTIPFEDPSFRNSAGGYIRDGSFPITVAD